MEWLKKQAYLISRGYTFLPVYLAVNISNKCNRSCKFCPYHSEHLEDNIHFGWFKAQPDFLSYNAFADFVINLALRVKLIKHIAITGKGEPMLHPDFFKFCYFINLCDIPFSITTNGDYLTEDKIKSLLTLEKLTEIRVSVYDIARLSYWGRISNQYPKINYYNQTGFNYPGLNNGYVTLSGAKGIEQFCTLPIDFNKNVPCKAPFSFLTINTDGTVVPCYSYNTIGRIEDSFWTLWNGKKIRKYRRDALRARAERSDCSNCGVNLK